METTTIEIKGNKEHPMRAEVFINGQQVYGVRSVVYEHYAGELPTLTMDLGGVEMESLRMNLNVDELVKLEIK